MRIKVLKKSMAWSTAYKQTIVVVNYFLEEMMMKGQNKKKKIIRMQIKFLTLSDKLPIQHWKVAREDLWTWQEVIGSWFV